MISKELIEQVASNCSNVKCITDGQLKESISYLESWYKNEDDKAFLDDYLKNNPSSGLQKAEGYIRVNMPMLLAEKSRRNI